jgi:transcriptional regulator with XRE-family HTH domain
VVTRKKPSLKSGHGNCGNFAYNLWQIRESRNMTIGDVSRGTGMAVAALSLLERGKRTPMLSTVLLLMEFFGVTFDTLVVEPFETESV